MNLVQATRNPSSSSLRLTASRAQFLHAVTAPRCHGMFFLTYCNDMRTAPLCLIVLLWSGQAHAALDWRYDGERNGQEEWHTISPRYATCAGTAQSPVSLGNTQVKPLPPLTFSYGGDRAIFTHERYSIVIRPTSPQQLEIGGRRFHLREMTIHTPSEHDIQGKFYPLELQLMHEDARGARLAVALFIDILDPTFSLDTMIDALPAQGKKNSAAIDWRSILPQKRGYFHYHGSITTPPCTEDVEWYILKEPLSLSYEQAKKITSLLGRNARMPQPLFLRTIEETE